MKQALNEKTICSLAPHRSLERGRDYYEHGLVRDLAVYDGAIIAKVKGGRTYTIKIDIDAGDDFHYSCTCPMGAEGEFCKHCVATALAWINSRDSKNTKATAIVNLTDVESYLHTLDKSLLVEMLMEQVLENELLWKNLYFKVSQAQSGGFDIANWKRAIRNAFEIDDFVSYRQTYQYIRGIDDVIDSVGELLDGPYATEVVELAEYALQQAAEALNYIDDSDGGMGDVMYRLHELHLKSCEKAKPDPEKLAAHLFDLELNSGGDVFSQSAKTYSALLGKEGLAIYRRLADQAWEKLASAVSKPDLRRPDSNMALNLIEIKETLAEMSGDIEELVDIKKRDLSYAYHYLQIAEIYQKAGNKDKALKWAEAGIKAFPSKTDFRLREFLADEYHRRKRHEEAVELIWTNFTDSLCLAKYQKLKKHAEKTGQWLIWREKAMRYLEKRLTKQGSKIDRWTYDPGYSTMVEILLWEKNPQGAWQAANLGGCTQSIWMKLAALREQDHPLDAVGVYRKYVNPTIEQTNNQAYAEAVKLIKKIQSLMLRLGESKVFATYLAELRMKYKAKRNFIKLLDQINV
jgi:hypothetical protein